MNKKSEVEKQNYTPDDSQVVVGLAVNFRKYHWKLVAVIFIPCLVAGLLVTAILGYVHIRDNDRAKIDQPKVLALISTNNCSDAAMQSVSAEKPNPKQLDYSISLLSYRSFCFDQRGQYQQAIDTYKQLKSYYEINHDTSMSTVVDGEISDDMYNIAHPVAEANGGETNPDTNPALIKSVNAPGKQQ